MHFCLRMASAQKSFGSGLGHARWKFWDFKLRLGCQFATSSRHKVRQSISDQRNFILRGSRLSCKLGFRRLTDMSTGKKLGRFRRFLWDPPKDAENWAQTIVRVLGNIFRTSLACIALLAIALGAAVGIGAAINQQAEANDPANLVTADIAIDSENCGRQSPWSVQIRNDSTKVLIEGTFELSMRERGSSRKLQLGGWSGAPIVVHKFVPPEHTYRFCTNAFTKAVAEAL